MNSINLNTQCVVRVPLTLSPSTVSPQELVLNHAIMSQIEEAELETRVFVGSSSAAWNELFLSQEHELRLQADEFTSSLKAHNHHTQNILTGLRSAAETHEQVSRGCNGPVIILW